MMRVPMKRSSRRARSGAATLEAILGMPMLVVVLLATFQYGVLMSVQHAVAQAAVVAAREAGKNPSIPIASLATVANTVLDPHCIAITNAVNSVARIVLEDGGGATTSYPNPANLTCNPSGPVLLASEVRVTVCVDLTTAPILNCLASFIGSPDFTGGRFEISSVVRKE